MGMRAGAVRVHEDSGDQDARALAPAETCVDASAGAGPTAPEGVDLVHSMASGRVKVPLTTRAYLVPLLLIAQGSGYEVLVNLEVSGRHDRGWHVVEAGGW